MVSDRPQAIGGNQKARSGLWVILNGLPIGIAQADARWSPTGRRPSAAIKTFGYFEWAADRA
jgi:hypothetical protein